MSRPLRVIHVAAGNLYGGVESMLATFARERARVPELEPEFAACFDGRLAAELRAAGAAVHLLGEVRMRDPVSVAAANLRFARVLRRRAYDAVVTHGAWPHVLLGPLARARGCRLVAFGHGAPLRRTWLDRLAEGVGRDLFIANSEHTLRAAGAAGQPNARVLYPPVEPRRPRMPRQEVRRLLGTPEDAVVIVIAARLERWKGHDLLLRAAARLARRTDVDFRIWHCGGAQREHEARYLLELRQLVQESELASRVSFLGERADVPELLAAADIYCQPNREPEPFGIVFVEALYAALPVVTTRMGGAAEIVDEHTGLLTDPEATAVADALEHLVSNADARRRLQAGGPRRASLLCAPADRIRGLAEMLAPLQGRTSSPLDRVGHA